MLAAQFLFLFLFFPLNCMISCTIKSSKWKMWWESSQDTQPEFHTSVFRHILFIYFKFLFYVKGKTIKKNFFCYLNPSMSIPWANICKLQMMTWDSFHIYIKILIISWKSFKLFLWAKVLTDWNQWSLKITIKILNHAL